jgi:hypothetical protein
LLVTAVAAALVLMLAGCSHDTELKETPQQIAQEQAAADAHNRDTVPSPGDDESPVTDAVSETSTTASAEYLQLTGVSVGDCVDLATFTTASVRAVACDRPHHAEVTAKIDVGPRFPNGAPTPEDYGRIRDTDCRAAFDSYVRQPPPDGVAAGGFNPRPETWYSGYRIVLCVAEATREGNVLTGSVRKGA